MKKTALITTTAALVGLTVVVGIAPSWSETDNRSQGTAAIAVQDDLPDIDALAKCPSQTS